MFKLTLPSCASNLFPRARILLYIILFLIALKNRGVLIALNEKGSYLLFDEPIDVVIPATDKDLPTLELCIEGIKTNGKGVRRIIVISDKKLTGSAEWFDEREYLFSKNEVAFQLCHGDEKLAEEYIHNSKNRTGWYYQQLLKLYAPFVIPNISSNVLVLDADTIFLNPTSFLDELNGGLLNVGVEFHKPYFIHMDKLTLGYITKQYVDYSGITHHMLFQKPVLEDLFNLVEKNHGVEFWKIFCLCVDHGEESGASEYEIYFNFVLTQTDQVKIRKLKWVNIRNLRRLDCYKEWGFHYVSCHSWNRHSETDSILQN